MKAFDDTKCGRTRYSNLVKVIWLRMRADVKVGVCLSDGIDSSVIAGVVAHLVKTRHDY